MEEGIISYCPWVVESWKGWGNLLQNKYNTLVIQIIVNENTYIPQ